MPTVTHVATVATAVLVALLLPALLAAEEITFPVDPTIIDVRRDCGAKGDGVADDTQALQDAIERPQDQHSHIIYLPNGTYRITRPLVFKPRGDGKEGAMVGPRIYGQHRERTIIRLADRSDGFTDPAKPKEAIRGVSRPDGARMNADFFDRTLVNLTIDTGDNPGAVGIKFYSNNTGLMREVTITGNGACGIDLGFNDQNGPHLIQDVAISGFAIGVRTDKIINSQALSRITVRGARIGLHHRGQVLAVEGLHVIGAATAVDTEGVLALVDATFEAPPGAAAEAPAIVLGAKGFLHVQRLATPGFAIAIAAPGAVTVKGPTVAEYSAHETVRLDPAGPTAALAMKPQPEPLVAWENDLTKWVCANDHGADAGDEDDDGPAIQKAIDAAAASGATTVYLRGGRGRDPNWYYLKSDVRVHGSVRRIIGLGFIRLLGGALADPRFPENLAKFTVADDPTGAPVVAFEHLQVFSPWPSFGVENRSRERTVVCRTFGGTLIARPGSRSFMTNAVGHLFLEKDAQVFARHYNTENPPKVVNVNTRNDGGRLWVLGLKTEAAGTKVLTRNGGVSELLGVLIYNTAGVKDDVPCLAVEDASLSCAAFREVCFTGAWWRVPVLERLAGQERKLPKKDWLTWSLLRAGK